MFARSRSRSNSPSDDDDTRQRNHRNHRPPTASNRPSTSNNRPSTASNWPHFERGQSHDDDDKDYTLVEAGTIDRYFCHVCQMSIYGVRKFQDHMNGEEHRQKKNNPDAGRVPARGRRQSESDEVKESVSILGNQNEPVIGLEYIVKITRKAKFPLYLCALCYETLTERNVSLHVADAVHKLAYLKKYYPEWYVKFTRQPDIRQWRPPDYFILDSFIAKLTERYGRLDLSQITLEDFPKRIVRLLNDVEKGRHSRLAAEVDFSDVGEPFSNLRISGDDLLTDSRKPKSRHLFLRSLVRDGSLAVELWGTNLNDDEERGGCGEGKRRRAEPHDLDGHSKRRHVERPAKKRLCAEHIAEHERLVKEIEQSFKQQDAKLCKELDREREYYRENFNNHPQYFEESRAFWEREGRTRDPRLQNSAEREWNEFWDNRLDDFHCRDLNERRKAIRRNLDEEFAERKECIMAKCRGDDCLGNRRREPSVAPVLQSQPSRRSSPSLFEVLHLLSGLADHLSVLYEAFSALYNRAKIGEKANPGSAAMLLDDQSNVKLLVEIKEHLQKKQAYRLMEGNDCKLAGKAVDGLTAVLARDRPSTSRLPSGQNSVQTPPQESGTIQMLKFLENVLAQQQQTSVATAPQPLIVQQPVAVQMQPSPAIPQQYFLPQQVPLQSQPGIPQMTLLQQQFPVQGLPPVTPQFQYAQQPVAMQPQQPVTMQPQHPVAAPPASYVQQQVPTQLQPPPNPDEEGLENTDIYNLIENFNMLNEPEREPFVNHLKEICGGDRNKLKRMIQQYCKPDSVLPLYLGMTDAFAPDSVRVEVPSAPRVPRTGQRPRQPAAQNVRVEVPFEPRVLRTGQRPQQPPAHGVGVEVPPEPRVLRTRPRPQQPPAQTEDAGETYIRKSSGRVPASAFASAPRRAELPANGPNTRNSGRGRGSPSADSPNTRNGARGRALFRHNWSATHNNPMPVVNPRDPRNKKK